MNIVSIIVPVYNMEKLLPRCINSILNQTYENFELILIDDGSQDSSGHICDEYKAKDCRVEVFHKKNGGIADAYNLAFEKINGEFVLFVDSDDYIQEDMLEKLISVQKNTDADIVQTGMTRINDNEVVTHIESFTPRVINSTENIIKEFFCGNDILLCLASKLFRRSLFENYRFESGRSIVDILCMPTLLQGSNKYAITDGAGYFAYFREGSVSRGFFKDNTYDDRKYYLKNWNNFIEKYYPENMEYKAMIFYRGTYEMSYNYSLLVKSPYISDKNKKKKEMKKLFFEYYKKLKKTDYISKINIKKRLAFSIFYISPVLFELFFNFNILLKKRDK